MRNKMNIKAPIPISSLNINNPSPIIQVYFEFVHLKHLYRQGWLKRGIPSDRCESVAEHSFGVSIIAMIIADNIFPELDLIKVLQMALIHDFGEVYTGDIIPEDKVSFEKKHKLERESVERIFESLPNGEKYLHIWDEYENGKTPEAQFVRQIDKLEMALQASVGTECVTGVITPITPNGACSITARP